MKGEWSGGGEREEVNEGWSFFFQAEDGIRDGLVTGVQTCALPISTGVGGAPVHGAPWTSVELPHGAPLWSSMVGDRKSVV